MQEAPIRDVTLWDSKVLSTTQADGSILVSQEEPLGSYPDRLSDRIKFWAQNTPDQIWMAERGKDDAWVNVTYAELLENIRSVGQFLLGLGLSTDRPLLILSGNSISHGIMALGAQYAGIPSAAIAPAYSLFAGDFKKLKSIGDQISPGAIFVDNSEKFLPAVSAVFSDLPLLAVEGEGVAHTYCDIVSTKADETVSAANAATGPNTIAKFMFTSGTTGSPKAVILTQKMICSNMEMVADCFAYFKNEPPILLDWAPWNHVAAGTKIFNMAIYNGGTFYIDGGKPTPALIGETIRNIREVSPNWYFNVPTGYDMLIEAMKEDEALAKSFFKNVKLFMYAGAAMAARTWSALDKLAIEATGERIMLCTGLGATETTPFALFCTDPQDLPGNVGIPSKGLTLKLVPNQGKFEARLKGPSVTPGYWRNEKLTKDAFDEDGFYCLGDALRFADIDDASKGFFFDGRVAENFKLATGTWVAVGALRSKVTDALEGIAKDVVIAGAGKNELTALLVPSRPIAERLIDGGDQLSDKELFAHPDLVDKVATLLGTYNKTAGGSSLRVMRVLFIIDALSLDAGEVTDKGSVNQRAVLASRASDADALYLDDPRVICAKRI
ncbi:MAG: feruloyl-CoA synthase [Hyphomicrobiales bacterium]|nr:feruloyl-CoA synthase [Hyphomicrobiales bacterium]PCH51551.1 MAG: feruloyl-CoA synthase [Hyphomicrobiales bacterium]